jgi:hypothetical protein
MKGKIKFSDISSDVNKISVFYDKNDVRKIKCFCGEMCNRSIIPHMKKITLKNGRNGAWTLFVYEIRDGQTGVSCGSIERFFPGLL